ncbi:MAG TPA: M20/M25/M40 family metallo-hydrolase [Dehalococcoidia bacterium]|nr:M20/M25/M40 family metallo-hydrolase [Dehalococcoidia bacterium]
MIDSRRLLATFLDLVAIDSPSGEEAAVAGHVTRVLEGLGARVREDAYGNLIATLGAGNEPFLLGSHLDTVEPGRGIKPLVVDGVVRTDGSTVLGGDAKAGIAAILEGLTAFAASGRPMPAVEIVLTRGEEAGLVGSANLDYSLIRARLGVEFDGEGPVSQITVEAPGRISAQLHFTGRAAHAGVEPEKGISAIQMAARFIAGFPQGRIDQETTANIGLISGGSAANAVPEHATLTAEARSRDPAKLAALREQVLALVDDVRSAFPGGAVRCDLREEFGGYKLPPEHPLLARVTGAMRRVGLTPEFIASGGATDANNFARHGIDVAVVGLGGFDFHTVRETLPIANLEDSARFCLALLEDLASGR